MTTSMSSPVERKPWPPRAVASIVSASFSLLVLRADLAIGDALGRLGNALESAKIDWARQSVSRTMIAAGNELAVIRCALSVVAVIWCVWAWRRESGLVVGVAALFTFFALVLNLWMLR